MGQRRDPQRHHVRGVGDQEQRYAEFHDEQARDPALNRIFHAHLPGHKQGHSHLHQAQQRLVQHVGGDVRRDVHTGTVLTLDHVPFATYDLNRVEAPVPDAYAHHGKGAHHGALHVDEELAANDHAHQAGDQRRHGQHLPVALVDKHPEQLAQIDENLRAAPAMADHKAPFGAFKSRFSHAVTPPHTSVYNRRPGRRRPPPCG